MSVPEIVAPSILPDGPGRCPVCQSSNPVTARHCGTCGTRLLFHCWSCGAEAVLGQQFCTGCGSGLILPATVADGAPREPLPAALLSARPLPAPSFAAAPLESAGRISGATTRPDAPAQTVGRPSAGAAMMATALGATALGATFPARGGEAATPSLDGAALLDDEDVLVEERRVVSVLFADIVGFTTLSERLDPEDVRELSAAVLARLAEAVSLYGGTIDKFMGDAIMALFGAPTAHEDDAVRAVHAAIAMHQAVGSLAQLDRDGKELELRLRIGVHTGEVIAGVRDVGGHREYSVFGDVVNTAARLQTAAEPGGTLMGEQTARQAGGVFDLAPVEPLMLRGKAQPVPAYSLRGALLRDVPVLAQRPQDRRFPLVGRLLELQELRRHVADLSRGRGQLSALIGEHGIGKTRLLAEVRDHAEELGLRWIEAAAPSHAQGLSYRLIREIVTRLLGVRPGGSDARLAAALSESLDRLQLSELLPPLGLILGAESDGEQTAGLTAAQLQWRVVEALRRLFAALMADRPLVLVLDALQWADPSSIDVLLELMPLTDEHPILFYYVFTPEPDAPSWQLKEQAARTFPHRYAEMVVHPLSEQAAHQLMCSLLSCSETPPNIEALVLERTDGNPFFIEEMLRALVDSGALRWSGETWVADHDVTELQIPQTLIATVLARIDRLAVGVRRTLQVAALVGREVSERVLRRVLDAGPELDRHLREALRAGLLREEAVIPERRYAFTQTLIHEAAAGSVLLRRRRELHVQIGWALEEIYSDNLEEQYGELARHFWEGESWERAFRYSRLAAEQAAAAYANDEAVAAFTIALESAARSAAGAAPEVVAMLAERRADIRTLLGQYDAALDDFKRALMVNLDALNDSEDGAITRQHKSVVGALALKMARLHSYAGDIDATRTKLEAAFRFLPDGSPDLASAWALKASMYTWASNAAAAAEAGRKALQIARERGSFRHLSEAYEALTHPSMMGELLDELPRLTDEWVTAARARPEERPILYKALTARALVRVWALWTFDAQDRADMEEALELSRSTGSTVGETTARGILGIGQVLLGEWQVAETNLQLATGLPTTIVGVGAIFEWWLMLLLTWRGDYDTAAEQMTVWLSDANNTHRAVLMGALLGVNRLRAGDDEAARSRLAAAGRVAEQLGCAQCSLTMEMLAAEALAELGDRAGAEGYSARARSQGTAFGRRAAVLAADRADTLLALHAGELDRARASVKSALRTADELAQPYELARTMIVAAEVHDAAGDTRAAERRRERAREILGGLGVRPGATVLRMRPEQPLQA
ncbi:MAG: AAA family ATPase [Chloroflexi bacterium]|nr:AAA family ATPase [Chloroflexota bacterium]